MPNASLPPPPPPPDCKVLGRLAAASALTLAAIVGGANPAQAAPLPDPPCAAATHFEAPGSGGGSAKCIPNSGDVFVIDNANDNPEGRAACEFFGGNVQVFSGNPWCLEDYIGKTGGASGNCQINRPNGCLPWFNQMRDCNKPGSNRPASVAGGGVITCGTACGTGEQAVGGNCRSGGINCSGDEVPNEAGDACVCPPAKPVRNIAGACAEQCGPGEEPDQAMQCGLCEAGYFKAAAGNGACEQCYPPLTQSRPGVSSLSGLQTEEGVANRVTRCEAIAECGTPGGEPGEQGRNDLELCGPNAKCFDLDPRVGNPNGFTVGEWRYRCECAEGFSDSDQGDHERKLNCSGTGARTVAILDSPNGTVSSTPPAGDVDFETRVVFTAAPDLGFMVSLWSGADEWVRSGNCDAGATRCEVTVTRAVTVGATFGDLNECDFTTGPNRFNCPSDSSCENLDATLGGDRFTCECAEALYEFDSVRVRCGCATTGHLIFGDEGNQRCASPVICPAGYGDSNFDCVEDEATPLTSSQVESIVLCEAFGGDREAVVDLSHPGVCSNVDINDTFCFLEAGEALSCRGLFEHVRDCNALNRPALDPWHCSRACGDKQARGRRCETVTR